MPRLGLTHHRVVEQAAEVADEAGLDRLTLAAVAKRLGISLPGLYKHIDSLDSLKRDLAVLGVQELTAAMSAAAVGRSGHDALRAMARAYRAYAAAHPGRAEASIRAPAPTDAEGVTALKSAVDTIGKVVGDKEGPGAAAATRLAAAFTGLINADAATRAKAQDLFVAPLKIALDGLQAVVQAKPITVMTLPPDLTAQWLKPDGRARVEIHPKGDPNDNEVLRRFASAVEDVEPSAAGGPISILESGRTVIRAFIQAGGWALLSIGLLLWVVLRRFTDVLLTLIPLVVAGLVTLEITVLIGMPLNFANIIALPLLLGVGVAFKIYYITAWRAGQTGLLQSSLTRAVIFSAMTTATAFGSLWLSSHPGTSSMGKLLALSLVSTLAAAVLFQPVLMGPPREIGE